MKMASIEEEKKLKISKILDKKEDSEVDEPMVVEEEPIIIEEGKQNEIQKIGNFKKKDDNKGRKRKEPGSLQRKIRELRGTQNSLNV